MAVIDPDKSDFAARSFLLVEDFEAMRGILRDLLRRCGAKRIEVAANGQEALAILRRGKCDVIVCDYHLGPGRNGQQVLEEARHEGLIGVATIWIMVTAEKTADMVMGAVEHQPDDYLLKPVTEAALQGRLERLIARKKTLSEIAAAMRAREYLRALELCRGRLEQDPGNPLETLRIQSDLYQLTGQPDRARALYESILGKRDVPWARAGLARLYVHEGKYERARSLLEQLIADIPGYMEAYDTLARVHQSRGAWPDAERVLLEAVRVSPLSPQRQNALGETALRCEHLDVAEQAYNKSLKLAASTTLKTAAPYLGLARVQCARNKPDEALKVLAQMSCELDGAEARLQARAEEARVFHAMGDTERAAAAAREVGDCIQAGAHSLSPTAILDLAETFMRLGSRDSASQLLQFVIRNNHEDDALAARALEVFENGEMGEEGRALIESSRREALDAMNQGARLAAQGKLGDALELMRQARTLMPRNPRLLLNHAYVVIACLQKDGWRHDLAAEARRSIATARLIVPGEKRCGELLARLESLG